MRRTYYDMDFEPDSIEFDGNHLGTPLAVTAREEGNGRARVLLDAEQVANLVEFLSDWLSKQPGRPAPTRRKWSDS